MLCCFALLCLSFFLSEHLSNHVHVYTSLSMEFGVFGGLIIAAFSFMLSLNSPVYQVEMLALLCFALVCIGDFELSQLVEHHA